MDGNKDEARKCARIGKEALEAGDRGRAIKFLTKAQRLDPTLEIDDLLSSAGRGGARVADDAGDSSSTSSDAPRNESDKAGKSSSASSSSANLRSRVRSSSNGSAATYTEEQITNYQGDKEEEGLLRDSGTRAKLHCGRCAQGIPEAFFEEEVFKAVSKAFQCLSNEESRRRYDVSGSDDPAPVRRHHQAHEHGFNGFYDADFDADEIFRNFFGGMNQATTPFGTFHFRTGGMGGNGGHGMQGSGNFNIRSLIQILPIIFILLLNFLPSSDPPYTFNRSYQYNYKVLTSRGVPFYVKSSNFEQEYPYQSSKRVELEAAIEKEYVGLLAQNCRHELQRQQWGFQHQTPHCDMLRNTEV
ncbi:Chaperone protein dnaJ 49 [Platanthera guangdongensis]|uniref:Chaperone protein dnaJ 49 n=1 Tax=Platanthera guangdongensis TaxID=2320717 RepID=A0ABR2LEM5_9ASPA